MNRQEKLLRRLAALDRISRVLARAKNLDDALKNTVAEIFSLFDADRAWLLYPCDPEAEFFQVPFEKTKIEFPGAYNLRENVPLDAAMRFIFQQHLNQDGALDLQIGSPAVQDTFSKSPVISKFDIKSQLSIILRPNIGKPWLLGLHQCSFARVWTEEEKKVFSEIAHRFSEILYHFITLHELEETKKQLGKKAETSTKKLRDTEFFLEKVFESTSNAIHVLDRHGVLQFCNSRLCEVTGYTKEELIGRHFSSLVHPRSLDPVRRNIHEILENGREFYGIHVDIIRKNGSISTVRSACTPLLEGEAITGVVCIAEDISQEEHNRKKLLDAYRHVGLINRQMGILLETKESLKKNSEENITLLLENGRKISGSDFCAIFVFDEKENYFELLASDGLSSKTQNQLSILSPKNCMLIEKVIQEKKTFTAPEIQLSDGCLKLFSGIESFFSPLLFWNGKMRGMLFFGFFQKKKMEKVQQELCEFYAVEASLGLFGEENGN